MGYQYYSVADSMWTDTKKKITAQQNKIEAQQVIISKLQNQQQRLEKEIRKLKR